MGRWGTVAGLAVLVATSVLLRLEGQTARLWIDEAISVGIASHPIGDIGRLLAQDGSPPLYYVLLHAWISVFGGSEIATHALSLLFAVGMVPAAYWAGRSLFDARAGWVGAALAVTNPFLSAYGAETRMYTMVALLGLIATTTFLHAFAFRRRRYLPAFFGVLVLLLYTHNWALFFMAAALVATGWCWLRSDDRRQVTIDGALVFGAAIVAYLPWIPTLVDQARHTGAPWSHRPLVREAFSALGTVLGDERAVVALALAGAGSLVVALRGRRREESNAVAAAIALVSVTLGLGWLASQLSPAWDARYFAVFVGPVLLLGGLGISREGKRGLLALGLILLFWVQPLGRLNGLRPSTSVKSDIGELVATVDHELRPNDLVVAMQLEETPVLSRYLPEGTRYAAADGPVDEPSLVNWRDAVDRMQAADPGRDLVPLVDALAPGQRVLLVCARPGLTGYDVEWFRLMRVNCARWKETLSADNRLQRLPLVVVEDDDEGLDDYLWLFSKVS